MTFGRRQFRERNEPEPDPGLVDALRYLAHEIEQQRTEQSARLDTLSVRLDKLSDRLERLSNEFETFRLQMTRDFTQLNTQVQTGVKMGWAVIGLLAGIIAAIVAQ